MYILFQQHFKTIFFLDFVNFNAKYLNYPKNLDTTEDLQAATRDLQFVSFASKS